MCVIFLYIFNDILIICGLLEYRVEEYFKLEWTSFLLSYFLTEVRPKFSDYKNLILSELSTL